MVHLCDEEIEKFQEIAAQQSVLDDIGTGLFETSYTFKDLHYSH